MIKISPLNGILKFKHLVEQLLLLSSSYFNYLQFADAMKLLIVFSAVLFGASAEKARFDNYEVHRLLPKTEKHLTVLKELARENAFDFWTEPASLNQPVDVMVPPHKRPEFSEFVSESGMQQGLFIENVQQLIDEEQSAIAMRNRALEWTNYHSLEEFYAWLEDLTETYKNVKKFVAGSTYEKRDIKGIEITFGANLRTVLIESTIHAREWISAASTSWVVNEILKSPTDSIWRKFNYIYIPFYNPDGYVYSWTTNRLWRKTRTPYKSGSKICYGVDPNRNWAFHWNEGGCSNDPCSDTYCGPSAFSEVETKTISKFLTANAKAKKIDVYLAFHSYSQLIMYPWGYSPNPTPLTKFWQRIGEAAAKDLAAVNKETFKVGDIYHTIYPSSGSSLEWYYGNYNSTITFVYELRDKGKYGFILPPQFIIPSAKELQASIQRILIEYSLLPSKY